MVATKQIERNRRNVSETPTEKLPSKEDNQKAFLAEASKAVDEAIASRKESLPKLYLGAAYAFYVMVVHGRADMFNRLYKELPTIDAEALKTRFVPKMHDTFGQGGIEGNPNPATGEKTWIKRPVSFVTFSTDEGRRSGNYFAVASIKNEEADRAKFINLAKQKVENAGVDAIAAIDWQSRVKMDNSAIPELPDLEDMKADILRIMKKYAPSVGVRGTRLYQSHFEDLFDIFAIGRKTASPIIQLIGKGAQSIADGTAKAPEHKPEGVEMKEGAKSDIPADHPSQKEGATEETSEQKAA